jgi:hypothetical protein
MFTGISWQSYLLMAGALSALYYSYIAVRYFRNDLTEWLSNKTSRRPSVKAATTGPLALGQHQPEITTTAHETDITSESEYDELEHLIGRVNKTISDAAIRKAQPEEVKEYLSLILKEYPSLKNDGMRPAINELVASECARQNILISEAEADRLWEQ